MSTPFEAPVVASHGADEREQPLVVLLHGRGSHEREIISLAPHLPQGATYAAVRAPIAEGVSSRCGIPVRAAMFSSSDSASASRSPSRWRSAGRRTGSTFRR